MPFKSDKVRKSLKKKGFTENNGDHKFLELKLDGKFVLHTKVSHGSTHDIDGYLIGQMARQCKLSKQDFSDLVNCPLSKEAYVKKIRDKGLEK